MLKHIYALYNMLYAGLEDVRLHALVLPLVTVLPGVGGLPDVGSASKKCIESIWII